VFYEPDGLSIEDRAAIIIKPELSNRRVERQHETVTADNTIRMSGVLSVRGNDLFLRNVVR
jgi:hypothetical protein